MLASSYEFVIDNQSGGILTDVTITFTPWKYGSNGALTYGTPIVRNATNLADAAVTQVGAAIVNTEFTGGHGVVEFTGGGATIATLYMRITGATELTTALISSTTPDGKDYGFEI